MPVFRLLVVLFRLFSAYTAERLFNTPRDMGSPHSDTLLPARCLELHPFFCMAVGCCFLVTVRAYLLPVSAPGTAALNAPVFLPLIGAIKAKIPQDPTPPMATCSPAVGPEPTQDHRPAHPPFLHSCTPWFTPARQHIRLQHENASLNLRHLKQRCPRG